MSLFRQLLLLFPPLHGLCLLFLHAKLLLLLPHNLQPVLQRLDVLQPLLLCQQLLLKLQLETLLLPFSLLLCHGQSSRDLEVFFGPFLMPTSFVLPSFPREPLDAMLMGLKLHHRQIIPVQRRRTRRQWHHLYSLRTVPAADSLMTLLTVPRRRRGLAQDQVRLDEQRPPSLLRFFFCGGDGGRVVVHFCAVSQRLRGGDKNCNNKNTGAGRDGKNKLEGAQLLSLGQ